VCDSRRRKSEAVIAAPGDGLACGDGGRNGNDNDGHPISPPLIEITWPV